MENLYNNLSRGLYILTQQKGVFFQGFSGRVWTFLLGFLMLIRHFIFKTAEFIGNSLKGGLMAAVFSGGPVLVK